MGAPLHSHLRYALRKAERHIVHLRVRRFANRTRFSALRLRQCRLDLQRRLGLRRRLGLQRRFGWRRGLDWRFRLARRLGW